jgi:hypothetical protein
MHFLYVTTADDLLFLQPRHGLYSLLPRRQFRRPVRICSIVPPTDVANQGMFGGAAGQAIDVPQGAAERAARSRQGIREINDVDIERDELAFEVTTLFGAPPIIPLEHNIEVEVLPNLDLIVSHGWDGHIDEAKAADDLKSFNERNDGRNPFMSDQHVVCDHTNNEEIAMILSAP